MKVVVVPQFLVEFCSAGFEGEDFRFRGPRDKKNPTAKMTTQRLIAALCFRIDRFVIEKY
jgi:hypothetical protein